MKPIRPLRVWTQKILPLVYDNSLSYYEVLSKVIHKVNEMIDFISDNIRDMIAPVIENYFVEIMYDEEEEQISFDIEEKENG